MLIIPILHSNPLLVKPDPPQPPLDPSDAAWADKWLRAKATR